MEAMKIDRCENVRNFGYDDIKFGEQFDFSACSRRVDSQLTGGNYEVLLQDLKRNDARALSPVVSVELDRQSLFSWISIVIHVDENVCVKETTSAHGAHRG